MSGGFARSYGRLTVVARAGGALVPVPGATVRLYLPGTTTPYGGALYPSADSLAPITFPVSADAAGTLDLWGDAPVRLDAEVSSAAYGTQRETLDLEPAPDAGDLRYVGAQGDVFDVRSYGAVGDGVADDAPALQAALDAAAAAGGGLVYVPPGTYLLAANIFVGSNTILCGAGEQSILKAGPAYPGGSWAGTGTHPGALVLNTGVGGAGNVNITIRDLAIDGSDTTPASVWVDSRWHLFLDRVTGGLLANLWLYDGINDGATLQACTEVTIRSCRLRGFRKAGYYLSGCDYCRVQGNFAQDCASSGYSIACAWWCTVTGNTDRGSGTGLFLTRGSKFCVVADNVLGSLQCLAEAMGTTSNPDHGPEDDWVYDGVTLNGVDRCEIARNTITKGAGLAAYLARNSRFVDNTVYDNGGFGIYLAGCANCVVRGNSVSNNGSPGGPWGIALVQMDAATGVPATVYCTENVVEHNEVYDTQGTPTQLGGILVTPAGSTGNVVRRNRVRNAAATYCFQFDAPVEVAENRGAEHVVVAAGTAIRPFTDQQAIAATAPVTSTATPTLDAGVDGQALTLRNIGLHAITLQDQATLAGSRLRLDAPTVALATYDTLHLVYSAASGDWLQVGGGISQADADTRFVNTTGDVMTGVLTVDPHLGVAAAPAAWGAGFAALQVGQQLALMGGAGLATAKLMANSYYDGAFRALATGPATRLEVEGGQFAFLTAPSVGAGAAQTFATAATITPGGAASFGGAVSAASAALTGSLSVGGPLSCSGYLGVTLPGPGYSVYPTADNAYNFGSSTNRWATLYATTGTINTSRRDAKLEHGSLDPDQALRAVLRTPIRQFAFTVAPERVQRGYYEDEADPLFMIGPGEVTPGNDAAIVAAALQALCARLGITA